jgi:hypothetical protein
MTQGSKFHHPSKDALHGSIPGTPCATQRHKLAKTGAVTMSDSQQADGAAAQDRARTFQENAEALDESRHKLDKSRARLSKLKDIQEQIWRLRKSSQA